jgi:3-deoxy-manno-octulosonate cytidylyltransferase (CMP-KDO synthetase)
LNEVRRLSRPLVLIPARLTSTRLPRKPLADIHGLPMIAHVLRRALEADVGPVAVACDETDLAAAGEAALYFTRATAPWGEGELLHHVGLYAYARAALETFVRLPPSALELRERLEQLRALEAGMRIDIALVDVAPLGVDTPHDLEEARLRLRRTP